MVYGSIHFSSLLSAMDGDVPHQFYKLHKVEDFFGIPVTAWVENPWMLNIIGYGRVSGKDGGTNQLAPAASGISYVVALGLGHLLM